MIVGANLVFGLKIQGPITSWASRAITRIAPTTVSTLLHKAQGGLRILDSLLLASWRVASLYQDKEVKTTSQMYQENDFANSVPQNIWDAPGRPATLP